MVAVPCTPVVAAFQSHLGILTFLFLELERLFQRNLQNTGTMRGRPRRDVSNFVSDENSNFRGVGLRYEKVPWYIHELLLAERVRELPAVDSTV